MEIWIEQESDTVQDLKGGVKFQMLPFALLLAPIHLPSDPNVSGHRANIFSMFS